MIGKLQWMPLYDTTNDGRNQSNNEDKTLNAK